MKDYKKLFIFYLCISSSISMAQELEVNFEHLSLQEGLSHNNVLSMLQDRKGFIWIGTYDGLNRYDGYNFKVFNHDYRDTTALAQNLILSLFEDSKGNIWVGTGGNGLCKFDPSTEKFTSYPKNKKKSDPYLPLTIPSISEDGYGNIWFGSTNGLYQVNTQTGILTQFEVLPGKADKLVVNTIYKDSAGNLWVGTIGHGLFLLPFESQKNIPINPGFIQYKNRPDKKKSLGNNEVVAIFEDYKGAIWIGTMDGLDRFDKKTGAFDHYKHDPANPLSLSSNQINIKSISEDHAGNLWIGTTFGLNKLNEDRTAITAYFHDPKNPASLSSNDVHSVLIDQTGALWVGTINGGISKSGLNQKQFLKFIHDPEDSNSLSHNGVRSLYEDHEGKLWIGTEGGGLNRYDKKTNSFKHYRHDPLKPESLSSDFIGAVMEDRNGDLWIGSGGSNYFSRNGGWSKLDRKTGNFTHFPVHSDDAPQWNDTKVFSIYEDRKGYLWLGTQNGIKQFDPKSGNVIHFLYYGNNPSDISDAWCYAVFEDSKDRLWIGTGSISLNRMDKKSGKFTYYSSNPFDSTSISSPSVRHIFEDKKGRLWFATNGGGLSLFHAESETFSAFTEKDGLPNNSVYRIEEDDEGNLWLSTNKGLSRFNPENGKIRNFDFSDGLQGNQFASGYVNSGSSFKGKDGTLYFGGSEGFNSFHPKDIGYNTHIPPIVITQFNVLDKPVPGIGDKQEITLDYQENIFSIEFAALNYKNPHKNQYAYQLENFDEDWIYSGTRRFASYTNLDPGSYVFRVKGSNNDGIWNEQGASLQLTILPPWWHTWWAYGIYGIMGITFLLGLRQYTVKRERLKHTLKLQLLEAEKMHELDSLKSRFFANISHEFRTPLSLILGPLEQFLSNEQQPQEKSRKMYRLMYRNGKRLLRLINQLLDLSKLEVGQLILQENPGNLTLFLKNIVYSFNSLAERQNIIFHTCFPTASSAFSFDADKLEKILINLISNAFKFTPSGGRVEVLLAINIPEQENPALNIRVIDTGIGIPKNQIEKVFDRFYQVDGSQTRKKEGSGIGLALTKELVSLYGGTIQVASNSEGTSFTVTLPLTLTVHTNHGNPGLENVQDWKPKTFVPEEEVGQGTPPTPPHSSHKKPLLLLVEDNLDVRVYMREFLGSQYRILEAKDGLEALDQAIHTLPDLIISDIMMPQMDGITLCRKLKTDERTSHIPIIILTARAGEACKLEGLETGADDYLTKPFHVRELSIRVKNLISQREMLRESFGKKLSLQPKDIAVTSTDDRFLQKALQIIEDNMAEPVFDVRIFSREIGMSRTQLHRKLKALTNQSPSEIVKAIRMKRAASLLEGQSGNISEVAFSVGFNSLTYFTRVFRQYYKETPSEYMHRNCKNIGKG